MQVTGGVAGRVRRLAAFTTLLLAVSAVPVIADSAPDLPPAVTLPESAGPSEVRPPDAQDMAQAFAQFEQEEEDESARLASPASAGEREDSRLAFTDVTPAAAARLLGVEFAERFDALDAEPGRFLSDATLGQALGATTATVRSEGHKQLLEGNIPVRARDEEGRLAKVDLTLEQTTSGYEPENPLVDLSIPESAGEDIEVGDSGLGISQAAGRAASEARPLGEMDIFYPEVLPDTDLVVSPISSGVELFNQLRSEVSPETLRFRVDLPAGALLRPNGTGGAEILGEGGTVAEVPAPIAEDAQGSEVPVELGVEGEFIVLEVAHRGDDYAYPILVDPILQDWYNANWYSGANLHALSNGAWQWNTNVNWIHGSTSCIFTCWQGSRRGLYISTQSGALPANGFGQFIYSAPNSETYLANAWINPFWRDNHGNCPQSQYPQPYDYNGMWSGTAWNRVLFNQANDFGAANIESWGRAFVIGMGTSTGAGIPCWRDIMAGGVAIWLEDWSRPVLSTSSTDQWMDATPARLNVSASDAGIGVEAFEAAATDATGASRVWWTEHPCTGLYESPCPHVWNLGDGSQPVLNYNPAVLPEGIVKLSVTGYDAIEKPTFTTNEMTVRIDHAAPTIALSGTLTEQATLGTERRSYTIRAEAKDGVPGSEVPSEVRSGVTSIVFRNDGEVVSEFKPGCATQSCSWFRELEVPAAELTPGSHTLTVTATDALGHVGTQTLHYTTGDRQPPALTVTGFPAADSSPPDYASWWSAFGSEGTGNGQFRYPTDVALDASGNLLVVDQFNHRIQRFDEDGNFLGKFGTSGGGNGQLAVPTALATDAKGNVWVADSGNNRLVLFNEKGEFVSKVGAPGFGNGQFKRPEGIAIDSKGNIWVADSFNGRLQKLNEKGEFLKVVSSQGSKPGQLGQPVGIDIDSKGNVWVADWGNNRIAVFDESGEFVRHFGSAGTGNGQFSRPATVVVGNRGDVWVSDQVNGRIQRFDQTGAYLSQFGFEGEGDGEFAYPRGLATDAKGNIWIADAENNRVQRWVVPDVTVNGFFAPLNAASTDSGFGVTSMTLKLTAVGAEPEVVEERTQGCPNGACALNAVFEEFDISENPTGAYVLSVTATDAAGNKTTRSRIVNLDSSPPQLTLAGPLADRDGLPLNAPSGGLTIEASDDDPAGGGIGSIAVERDGQTVASFPCSDDCDDFAASYTYRAAVDGASRAIQPVSHVGEGSVGKLRRLSCTAPDDCWAIGKTEPTLAEAGEGKTSVSLLEHWDGTEWQAVAVPKPAGANTVTFESISCTGTNACLVVGSYNGGSGARPLVEYWDGVKWTPGTGALPGGVSRGSLLGVSCGAANDCWAHGRTQLSSAEQLEGKATFPFFEHWNGTEWRVEAAPKPDGVTTGISLDSVSCAGPSACVAVGPSSGGLKPLVELWNGTAWTASTGALPSGTRGSLLEVSCGAVNDCWAFGRTQVIFAEQMEGKSAFPFFEHWNGSEWQVVPMPTPPGATTTTPEAISCSSPSYCLAVGRFVNDQAERPPFAMTWDGAEWRFQPVPSPPEATNSALEGVSCTGTGRCAMTGNSRVGNGRQTVLAVREAPGKSPHTIAVEAVDSRGNSARRSIEVDDPRESRCAAGLRPGRRFRAP